MKYILIYGGPAIGFAYVGPFKSRLDAETYASVDNSGDWWVVLLQAPDKGVAA
jgi:hypothetical protein